MIHKGRLEKQRGISATIESLEESRQHNKPYAVKFFGKKFIVLPGVFSPKYFDDAKFFGVHLPKIAEGKRLLEMGSGTGILSILCAQNRAKVTAVDINPIAVENTKQNAEMHNVKIDVRLSDLFSSVKKNETFELIFWNHPFGWAARKPKDLLESSVIDREHKSLGRFLKQAKNHLLEGGKVLLGSSSLATRKEIERLAREKGYRIKLHVKSEKEFVETDLPIDLRIYELTPASGVKK